MKNKKNHVCLICGKPYRACQSCENVKSFQPWRTITDTLTCYKIFLILNSYSNGYTNRTEAKEQLSSCDLSQLDSFIPHIQESVRQLLEKPEDTI